MRTGPGCSVLLVVLLSGTAQAQTKQNSVAVTRLAQDRYEMKLETPLPLEQAQASLLPVARQLCAGLEAKLTHYRFDRMEPQGSAPLAQAPTTTLVQEVQCGAATTPSSPIPLAKHDDDLIRRLSAAYFATRDAGHYAKAYAMYADLFKAGMPEKDWIGAMRSFNESAGGVQSRSIRKITWYDNPADAPEPGTYVAADYNSQFAKLAVHCGFIVWHADANGVFHAMREEENYISKAEQAKLSAEQFAAMKEKFGC